LGASTFLEKSGKLKPVNRKRVGIAGMKAPARAHTEIFTADGKTKIGEITSGGFGPSFKAPVAMGYDIKYVIHQRNLFNLCSYVATSYHGSDSNDVSLNIRGKSTPAQVNSIFCYFDIFQ
jgi:glycine cleavage system aminomethyltransferase T